MSPARNCFLIRVQKGRYVAVRVIGFFVDFARHMIFRLSTTSHATKIVKVNGTWYLPVGWPMYMYSRDIPITRLPQGILIIHPTKAGSLPYLHPGLFRVSIGRDNHGSTTEEPRDNLGTTLSMHGSLAVSKIAISCPKITVRNNNPDPEIQLKCLVLIALSTLISLFFFSRS